MKASVLLQARPVRFWALVLVIVTACEPAAPQGGRVVTVSKQDLVLDIEVTGTLKSTDSMQIGPPSSVTDTWEFKIIRMAPEGAKVKLEQEVIGFDPSGLSQKLVEYESEVAKSKEELGKLRAESSLAVLTDHLELEDAEAKRRKAELKADKPVDLTGQLTLKVAAIERDLARQEVAFRQTREGAKRRQEKSNLAIVQSRLALAEKRVAEIKASMEAMSVKAKREGTVVYKQDFRGEKKKPGDGMWRGEPVLEIASLDKMAATGQVDEVDASKVAIGQRVGLRLEAHPDREYAGKVARVASLVQTESPESRVKIVTLEIKLDETDAMLMRPGMRFRGRIEIARLPDVLQVPLAAITSSPRGPEVTKVGGGTPSVIPVKLGRRGREVIEILGGVSPGDRILVKSTGGPGGSSGFRLGAS